MNSLNYLCKKAEVGLQPCNPEFSRSDASIQQARQHLPCDFANKNQELDCVSSQPTVAVPRANL